MTVPILNLSEPASEGDWRALVEQGLKGAQWSRLVGKTADGIALEPLYRETDIATTRDVSGMPGGAPFVRGERQGAWAIRQAFEHPDPEQTNRDILADLAGGVSAIELVVGARGVAIGSAVDLDLALADVILEAAPVSLDGGADGLIVANFLRDKLKGVAAPGTAFNLDAVGAALRGETLDAGASFAFAASAATELPHARALRADARLVHEAGGSEAQEIAYALHAGIAYLRGLTGAGLTAEQAAKTIAFAVSIGPDVLVEAAKLRALRLCWARVLEASNVPAAARAAYVHAFSSRRMMTRYDSWTNILRVTTAAFAAAIGGADAITTYPLTDALGLPTPFARRVARNTQSVLLEECRLGHVADPAGGAWFVERLTRELAARAWSIMQQLEAATDPGATLAELVTEMRTQRQRAIATRRETITGVTDFPLLDETTPEFIERARSADTGGPFAPVRWAAPFEALRAKAATSAPRVFFANMASLAEFGPRAQWSRNLLGAGGIGSIGPEDAHATMEALVDAFRTSRARVALIASTDASYAEHTENAAQRLKAAGATWVVLAGKPGDNEARWRAAGVDQFLFAGADAIKELETLHAALGIGA